MKQQLPYIEAKKLAEQIVDRLKPHCEIIFIAGSIRREKPLIGDIEIVCLPNRAVTQSDMFNKYTRDYVVSPEFQKEVLSLGAVIKGNPSGKYMQIQTTELQLDLFMPDDFDIFRQLAIRTGPANYSQYIIAGGWRRAGWCGSDKGLRKITDCKQIISGKSGKQTWKCINENAELPPHWQSELDFFKWINVPYEEPRFRNVQ